jgi:hypothetical protein
LSPYSQYYTWDEESHNYFNYEPTPVYEEPTPIYEEPTPYYEEPVAASSCSGAIEYPEWSNVYEAPAVPLYTYNEEQNEYIPSENYNTYSDYYYYSEPTNNFEYYEPSPVQWNSYYEQPSVDLYYYD